MGDQVTCIADGTLARLLTMWSKVCQVVKNLRMVAHGQPLHIFDRVVKNLLGGQKSAYGTP